MKSINSKLFFFIAVFLIISFGKNEVDLVVINAKIYTVNDQFSIAKSMAIKNGEIIDIDIDNLDSKYNSKKIIDLAGQTIIPGIIDSHCHFYNLGLDQQVVDLRETKSFEEIIQRLKNYELKNDTDVILGRGWDQNDWDKKSFPVNTKLNEEFKDKLVVLERIDGHAYIVNDNVLQLSGIDKNTLVRGGLVLLKDDKPTGVLIDGPMSLVDQVLPEKTLNEKINALKQAEDICFSYGLTTVDDAGLSTNITSIIDSLHKSNDLKIKIYAMISVSRKNIEKFKKEGIYKSKKLNIRSFKVYGDGALGSRGAVLKNPYCDDPHNYGILRTSTEDLKFYAKEIANMGFQMNTHAIGDSTVSVLLNEYKKVLHAIDDPRWRIEHSQVVDANEFELYNDKILPSIQPTHATSDMYWAYDRLGDRIKGAYAFKNLLKSSGKVALGTDFPVEKVNPFHTFYSSVERKDLKGYPENGFQMENSLSREETLKGMTIWGAYFNFEDHEKGSLEIGKSADFVVLNQNIMEIEAELIPKTEVVYTFLDGELVYSR
ncbi:MAG: amidohydrolase [Cryomorphaceae bacterium]|nr:MAG: amidohydrolase [Cryomorphaceae bacterium]|tara:strand:+ start:61 stop:1689 length:1629 start_codon:yes stop_codon:yes gene_type:complete